MNKNILVRTESPADIIAIHKINVLAFGRPNEADLVEALRKNARPFLSLVAVLENRAVGHICFSPVSIESGDGPTAALGLAPMAVLPEYQRQGIGTRLIREGMEACRRVNHPVIFVLGHPDFYSRFGFVPASSKGLRCEYPVPDNVFMVAELTHGALEGRKGLVKYRSEFPQINEI